MEERRLLTAKEAAAYLRISLFTLRKIEQQGLVVPYRTPGGHRRPLDPQRRHHRRHDQLYRQRHNRSGQHRVNAHG